MSDAMLNRLAKRARHLRKVADRWPTDAYRIYDRDIPEYPWAVDRYADWAVIQSFAPRHMTEETLEAQRQAVAQATAAALDIPLEHVVSKQRERQSGDAQYERQGAQQRDHIVTESDLRFIVNLHDYIDTGLFLDHRPMRRMAADALSERGSGARFLNLFAYTGAFTVHAAARHAQTTTVDMSSTYLDWAKRNLELNGFEPSRHLILRHDVLRWLPTEVHLRPQFYDVIVLDPPTFSRSKRMERDLDIQRDHVALLRDTIALLKPDGVLFFSTNFRGFRPDFATLPARAQEITHLTVPEGFRPGIHRAWRLEPEG